MPHPLTRSLSAVSTATGWLEILPSRPDDDRGWLPADRLLDEPSLLRGWVDDVTWALTQAERRPPPPATPAAYVMGWYLQVPATVGALLFHIARRVPLLAPEDLAVRRAPFGYVDAVAVSGRRFHCLTDDPDAAHPDAVPVPGPSELAAVLREHVVRHAERFHSAFRPDVKFGSRQRWGMVLDVLDTALWQAGQAAGDEDAGVRDARLVLDRAHPPLTSGSTLKPTQGGGWTRRRQSCCFMFALPPAGAGSERVCSTCPRLGR